MLISLSIEHLQSFFLLRVSSNVGIINATLLLICLSHLFYSRHLVRIGFVFSPIVLSLLFFNLFRHYLSFAVDASLKTRSKKIGEKEREYVV